MSLAKTSDGLKGYAVVLSQTELDLVSRMLGSPWSTQGPLRSIYSSKYIGDGVLSLSLLGENTNCALLAFYPPNSGPKLQVSFGCDSVRVFEREIFEGYTLNVLCFLERGQPDNFVRVAIFVSSDGHIDQIRCFGSDTTFSEVLAIPQI